MAIRLRRWRQLALVLLVRGGAASLQNVTMDDTDSTIQYSANWGIHCPLPPIHCPDPTQINEGTLHWIPSSAGPSNITIRFAGTAVYVYNVLANFPIVSKAKIAFTLDGTLVRPYEQPDISGSSYLYNQLVYENASLPNGAHELVITPDKSLVMFDYVTYTSSDNASSRAAPPSPSSTPPAPPNSPGLSTILTVTTSLPYTHTVTTMFSSPETQATATTTAATPVLSVTASPEEGPSRSTGAIAGGVVGGVLALLLLAMITLFVRRRFSSRWNGKRMGRLLDEDPTPYRNDSDHSTSNRNQFLYPTFPALRPSPDVPRSPGYTMSSMPTSPTSYGGEPPSRTYMCDGTVAKILEKADRRMEWPSSPATKPIPMEFSFQ